MPIIVVTGKEIEKIKGDFESYLNGLNMVGEISYSQYSELYDEGTKQIQKAYELGKKANEWYYVKDEFPPENVPLNIITLDKNKKRRLWVGEYKGGNGEYWSGYFNHFIDVPYAWKEIVLPKESE